MWGEIPGQDGYNAYTIASYFILFGVIVTHLKSRSQLARILVATVLMGFLVGVYGMFQHSGNDFLNISESTGGGSYRVSIFMGNAIFSAAVLSMTIIVTLMTSAIYFDDKSNQHRSLSSKYRQLKQDFVATSIWASILTVQLISMVFTLSRGASIGVSLGILVFFGFVVLSLGWQMFIRVSLVVGLAIIFSTGYLHLTGNVTLVDLGSWLGLVMFVFGLAITFSILFINKKYGQKIVLIAVIGAAVTIVGAAALALSVMSGPGTSESSDSGARLSATTQQFANRISSISTDIRSGFGGRASHWNASWDLITNRPWFEFDDLSLPWIRPFIGYGPDLFRYTFLLKSPPDGPHLQPLEPDNAHNFFIHQTVEQGVFGGVTSLALFTSIFGIATHHLLIKRHTGNTVYRLLIFGLTAVVLARFLEMMFGVARISDLTILWVVFGLYIASARFNEGHKEGASDATNQSPRTLSRRERIRVSRDTSFNSAKSGLIFRLIIVGWLVVIIGIVTWQKGINPVRAAVAERQGIEYFQNSDFKNALEKLDKAITLAPGVPQYYSNRAQLFSAYRNQGNLTEPTCSTQVENPYQICLMLQSFDTQLESVNQQPFFYRSRIEAANSAFALQLSDSAIGLYRDAVNMLPNSYHLLNDSAETQIDLGLYDGALTDLDRSLDITGESLYSHQALYLKGRLLFETGQYDDAIHPLKHGLAVKPTNNDLRDLTIYFLRDIYTIKGVINDVNYFDNLISVNPNDGVAFYFRGLANLRLGNTNEAASDAATAHRFFIPQNPWHSESTRRQSLRIKTTSDALYAISNALQIEPDDKRYESALMIIGQSYLNLELWKAAADIFTDLISISASEAATYKNRGDALFGLKRYTESIKDYEKATALNPDDSVNFIALGEGYAALGDYETARSYFDQAIQVSPNNSDAYASRGFLSVQSGDYSKAFPDIDHAIKLSPDNHDAYFKKSQAYIGLEQPQLALDNLDNAITFAPINADYFYNRGLLKSQLNRLEEAISDHTISIQLYSTIEIDNFDGLTKYDPRYAQPRIARGALYLLTDAPQDYRLHIAVEDAEWAINLLEQQFNAPEWDYYKPTINSKLTEAYELLSDTYSALDSR